MYADPYAVCTEAWAEGWTLPLVLSVSEWADEYRLLNQKNAAEPGRWRTARTPYLREIMDCLSPENPAEIVALMAGTQVGKTEGGNNWIGHTIDIDPAPMMVVMPTGTLSKRWSRQRLTPLLNDTPRLVAKMTGNRSRDESNTTLMKDFEGGMLVIAGANSAADLRSMPVRKLFLDEVDAYPHDVDGEGDPVALAMNRTDTFARRKILITSTPTTAEFSRIDSMLKQSDYRRYHVPCPHCEGLQWLKWPNMKWDKDAEGKALPKTARYACEHCGVLIEEHHKTWMLERGQWIADKTGTDGKIVGFHLSSLYSPLGWRAWSALAGQFVQAQIRASAGDTTLLKAFINNRLAEVWEEQGDKVEMGKLQARAEAYALGTVPLKALVLTAAVDVQGNRLEFKLKGWAEGEENWTCDYRVIWGDPGQPEVWKELDALLLAKYPHASGHDLMIDACAIDSGGHHTQEVYAFCKGRAHRRVFAVKGASTAPKSLLGKPSAVEFNYKGVKVKGGAQVWIIGTEIAKGVIYARLRIEEPGPGYCHHSKELSADYYEQLTAERLVTRYSKGRAKLEWVKPAGKRNEALDLDVYNLVCAHYLGLPRWPARNWAALRARLAPDLFVVPPPAANEEASTDTHPAKNHAEPGQTAAPGVAERTATPGSLKRKERALPRKPRGFANNW